MNHHYYAPNIDFELAENNGWRLSTPSREWVLSHRRALLPQYFTSTQIGSTGRGVFNYFYATYSIDESEELVMFITYPFSFYIRKMIHGEGEYADIYYSDNSNSCIRVKGHEILIGIYRIAVDFDNTSVYFLKGKRKIQGTETRFARIPFEGERLPDAVYNLGSDELIKAKQQEIVMGKPREYSSFLFLFKGMTCTDYEDAVFVLDGLYHQGKRLPSLKVHMKYYDFNAVPEYIGPEALPAQ